MADCDVLSGREGAGAKSSDNIMSAQCFSHEGWSPGSSAAAMAKPIELANDVDMPDLWQRAALRDETDWAISVPRGFNELKPGQSPQYGDIAAMPASKDLVMAVDKEVMKDYSTRLIVRTIDIVNGTSRTQPLDEFQRTHPTARFFRK